MKDNTDLPATHMFIHKWNEPCLPLLASRRISPHFDWYTFPVPHGVGGWVGLGGWLHTEVVCTSEDSHPSQY